MWAELFFNVCILLVMISGYGMAEKRGEYRKPRLFTFNALDEDVTVSIEHIAHWNQYRH